jgi:hypothetical protein
MILIYNHFLNNLLLFIKYFGFDANKSCGLIEKKIKNGLMIRNLNHFSVKGIYGLVLCLWC